MTSMFAAGYRKIRVASGKSVSTCMSCSAISESVGYMSINKPRGSFIAVFIGQYYNSEKVKSPAVRSVNNN